MSSFTEGRLHLSVLAVGLVFAGALSAQQEPPAFVEIVDDFSRGSGGWLPSFSDYSLAQGGMDRLAEIRSAPATQDDEEQPEDQAYYLQGMNTSDDLFMFLKKPLSSEDGIEAGAMYSVEILVELYSSARSGCVGIGGAPGESVYFKVGASMQEPVPILEDEDVRLSVDKGNQASGGENAVVAGNIANGLECTDENQGQFVLIERRAELEEPVQATPSGDLWIFVGTDSGFEGTTSLYYSRIVAVLSRMEATAQ